MVKGIKLKEPPKMNEYLEEDILLELDVLGEKAEDKIVQNRSEGVNMREFVGEKFHILMMSFKGKKNEMARDSLMRVVSTLELASPELIKSFLWKGDRVVLAFPSMIDNSGIDILKVIVEELLRFTTFCISEFDSESQINSMIKNYISLFIKW